MKFHGRIALAAIAVLALALPASASATTATKHHLVMYKQEQHITLPEYDTNTYSLSCPSGDIAADGMWRIDEVGPYNAQLADPDEQPWTVGTGVSVLAAYPTGTSSYQFVFRNNTSEDGQLKVWVTCLGSATAADTHQHSMVVSSISQHNYDYGPQGTSVQDSSPADSCGSDEYFISPGFKVDTGQAYLFASYPSSSDLNAWNYGFYIESPGTTLTVYGRCLKHFTGYTNGWPKHHKHKIYAFLKDSPVQHFDKGNGVWEHQISCDDNQKGLVGGFNVGDASFDWNSYSWYWLGMDPRIKARAYRTLGTHAGGHYYLVCFNDRTSRPFYS